jgi:ATP-dependent DNA ligase
VAGGWRGGSGTGTVRFYPFDLLRFEGVDLRDRPWLERTERLLADAHDAAGR